MAVKDKLIVPVEIPMWAALSLIGSGLFTAGVLNNKMDVLVEQAKKVDVIYERQIVNIETLKRLTTEVHNLETRVSRVERGASSPRKE